MRLVSELLAPRLKVARRLVETLNQYINIVKDYVQGLNPTEYKDITASQAFIDDLLKEIPEYVKNKLNTVTNTTKRLNAAYELYEKLAALNTTIHKMLDLLKNETYTKMAVYNMSATYVQNAYQIKNRALVLYEDFIAAEIDSDEDIFVTLLAPVDINDLYSFIVQHQTSMNKLIIKAVTRVMNQIKDERRRRIEHVIEQQKDAVLGAKRINITNYPAAQGVLVRYGLSPVTESQPLGDIISMIVGSGLTGHDINTALDDLERLATEHNIGVILINRAFGTPLEFSLRGLIDIKYITQNDLTTKPTNGLNKKILERFNTIRYLPHNSGAVAASRTSAASAAVKVYKPAKTTPDELLWYVIETIDGNNYRLLSKNLDAADVAGWALRREQIVGLIDGLSTRPDEYNRIQSETIVNEAVDPKSTLLLQAYQEQHTTAGSSDVIKSAIVDQLTKRFTDRLHQSTLDDPTIVDSYATDQTMVSAGTMDVLLKSLGMRDTGTGELLLTNLARFEFIIVRFMQEFERKWNKSKIPPRTYKETPRPELITVIAQVYSTTVKAAADELDKIGAWTGHEMPLKQFFIETKNVKL